MNYFIADPHFGHTRIIEMCKRPFKSVQEMDEAIIFNWNKVVNKSDDVHIVGDFMLSGNAEKYLLRLNGKKHLIIGNHDKDWLKKIHPEIYFESIDYMSVVTTKEGKATLCHYPMMDYDTKYQIYGHIHNNTKDDYFPLLIRMENSLNAGVEVNNYTPVTIKELIENNIKFRKMFQRR